MLQKEMSVAHPPPHPLETCMIIPLKKGCIQNGMLEKTRKNLADICHYMGWFHLVIY